MQEPKPIRSFHDLGVWVRSIDLSLSVYAATQDFPRSELYGLTSQMRRAAVGVASCIAEGHSRSTASYLHFLEIALGSNSELQTQLVIARRLGLGQQEKIERAERISTEVGKMLNSLRSKLSRSTNR
jgi:four helix bundle protein